MVLAGDSFVSAGWLRWKRRYENWKSSARAPGSWDDTTSLQHSASFDRGREESFHPTTHDGALAAVVADTWASFERAAKMGVRVTPAVTILFFGDIEAYLVSPFRVVTVGLNPSLTEFPQHDPFCRFPLAADAGPGDQDRYLAALSAYFRTVPYSSWFASFEPLLNGANTSYYPEATATALHTDICSPVATNPTWSGLTNVDREALETDGGRLWHQLLEVLQPDVVVLSVAQRHLDRVRFEAIDDWQVVHTITHKVDGTRRARPYDIIGRWHQSATNHRCSSTAPPATKPLPIGNNQKHELGRVISDTYRHGP